MTMPTTWRLAQRNLLLTLDVFETLIHPRKRIGETYLEMAREFGLNFRMAIPETVEKAFRAGLRGQSHTRHQQYTKKKKINPLYGKAMGISTEEWWANVITETLSHFTSDPIPPELAVRLFHHFSSAEGYELYPDVVPFLETIQTKPAVWPYSPLSTNLIMKFNERFHEVLPANSTRELMKLESEAFYQNLLEIHPPQDQNEPKLTDVTILGIVSNSDPRVPLILHSLGIKHFFPTPLTCLSHEMGVQKPSREIYRQARERAMLITGIKDWQEWDVVHIGNLPKEDFETPEKLKGFKGVWLDRRKKAKNMSRPTGHDKVTRRIESLTEVFELIGKRWREDMEKDQRSQREKEEELRYLQELMSKKGRRVRSNGK